MSDAVVEVRDLAHYEELIAGDLPVIIDHTAGWCAPCQQMAPDLHEFADKHLGELVVAKVDNDHGSPITVREPLRTLPTLVLHDRGAIRMAVARRLFIEQLEDVFGGYLDHREVASTGQGANPLWVSRPERVIEADPTRTLGLLVRGGETFQMPDPSATQVVVPEGQVLDLMIGAMPGEPLDLSVLEGFDRTLPDQVSIMAPVGPDLVDELVTFTEVRNLNLMRSELTDDQVVALVSGLPKLASIGIGQGPPSESLAARLADEAPKVVTYGAWAAPAVHAARASAGLAPLRSQAALLPNRRLSGALAANRRDGNLNAFVTLTLPEGWHAYGPDSSEGVPASIEFADPSVKLATLPEWPADERGHLTGECKLQLALSGDVDELVVRATVQLCNDELCDPPKTIELRAPVRG